MPYSLFLSRWIGAHYDRPAIHSSGCNYRMGTISPFYPFSPFLKIPRSIVLLTFFCYARYLRTDPGFSPVHALLIQAVKFHSNPCQFLIPFSPLLQRFQRVQIY
ncbi:MAG: hypothetical protein QXU18_12705, partial [Thermoplasmatales archaeon]